MCCCWHASTDTQLWLNCLVARTCAKLRGRKGWKRGQHRAFCRCSWFLCKDTSADASESKRLYCVLDKVLVCLCRFWLTHRSLRARSVCLLGTAELHPELRFPKPHQTPRLDIEDAATVYAKLKIVWVSLDKKFVPQDPLNLAIIWCVMIVDSSLNSYRWVL